MATIIGVKNCPQCAYCFTENGNHFCRLNPPSTHPLMGMTPQGVSVTGWTSSFPPVNEATRCGQWRTRIETPDGSLQ